MAEVTISSSRFPQSTTVGAYERTTDLPPTGAPPGSAEATGTVAANGTVNLSGLDVGTRYWAYADVSGTHVYVGFTPDESEILTPGGVEIVVAYDDPGSFQPVAGDLELTAGAGTSDQGDTSFLGGLMGNILGAALTKTHNFIGGLIGAYSIETSNASLLQKAGVIGIIMDGAADADAAVVAVIDGGDPSSTTRARAAFAAMINNNSGDSGVDYGLDLHDAGRDETLYTGGGDPLEIANADLRLSNELCIFSSATEPVDGTTGADFAEKGSICVARDTGFAYSNEGTKASPTWNLTGEQGS